MEVWRCEACSFKGPLTHFAIVATETNAEGAVVHYHCDASCVRNQPCGCGPIIQLSWEKEITT